MIIRSNSHQRQALFYEIFVQLSILRGSAFSEKEIVVVFCKLDKPDQFLL